MGQYFTEVVFTTCYKWSYFDSVVEILSTTIQMKATEQYFPVVPYQVVLTFELAK